MQNIVRALLAISAVACTSPVQAQKAASRLDWMAGCWERRNGPRLIEETWLAPRGGMMLGVSRTTIGDSLITWEQLRIRSAGDTIVYHAMPAGQPATDFRAVGDVSRSVSFENPTHDFPQRVMYRAAGNDSLVARIEGTRNGQLRGIEYPYRRVACAGSARVP